MVDTSERGRPIHTGAEMRPRRWYSDERAPPRRVARMTSELWRYRSLAQRHTNDAAPATGAASYMSTRNLPIFSFLVVRYAATARDKSIALVDLHGTLCHPSLEIAGANMDAPF
jgi:hypothetical protein